MWEIFNVQWTFCHLMFPTYKLKERKYLTFIILHPVICFGLGTPHCLCVSYRDARVSKCMQAFSEGTQIIDIISASDWVDLSLCGIISLKIPITLFSSKAQNKMALACNISSCDSLNTVLWNISGRTSCTVEPLLSNFFHFFNEGCRFLQHLASSVNLRGSKFV